jgi:MerR family transcriptional regulator/heat shock protein HspR
MASRSDRDQAIYIISVAAELAGVHPQTLRVYERKGLVHPQRTQGNTRRYSEQDIKLLRRIQELTNQGVNLAGVTRILELETQLERLRARNDRLADDLEVAEGRLQEYLDTRNSMALVPFRDMRRVRRALKSDQIEEATRRRTFPAPPAG